MCEDYGDGFLEASPALQTWEWEFISQESTEKPGQMC